MLTVSQILLLLALFALSTAAVSYSSSYGTYIIVLSGIELTVISGITGKLVQLLHMDIIAAAAAATGQQFTMF